MPEMEPMKDYCQQRLLVVGSVRDVKVFDRSAELPGATDIALLEHTPTRLAWQFVMARPVLPLVRRLSRRWSRLTFVLNYDCEDHHLAGLIRAKNRTAASSSIKILTR
jgi:hypothetical protein